MAKPKAKVKPKTKVKTSSTLKLKTEKSKILLNKEQEFYVKGNLEILSPDQMARDMKVPVESVNAFIATYDTTKKTSRTSDLMQRPAKGVVAMTEAASMVADGFKDNSGIITQAEINLASNAGKYELAAELAKKREEQITNSNLSKKQRYNDSWHLIDPEGGVR